VSQTGRFISFEGIEGAGKTTLVRALEAALMARGLRVALTREPGGTPLAERLRSIALERGSERINAQSETLIMFAARAIHVENLIRPALASGQWVLCDRFTDATRAYQGAGRGVDSELIETLAAAVHADLWPDRTLLLDVPVEQGLARARARQGGGDRFEDEDVKFFSRVRACYRSLSVSEPERVRLIDASAGPEQVMRYALQALADLLPPQVAR
jgi:dTMP kinase